MTEPHSYDDEEVREILRRALEEDSGLGHRELADAAAEVGIDAQRFERAAEAVRSERSFGAAVERRRSKRRGRLARTGATYLVINLFLLAVDAVTGGGWWFYWPALSMALLYALQVIGYFSVDDEAAVKREEEKRAKQLRKRNRKERRRERAEARRARRKRGKERLKSAEDAFEDAVEEGLARLLESVAGAVSRFGGDVAERAEGELADFIARKEGRPRRQRRSTPDGPRPVPAVRVDAEDEAEDEEMREALAEVERELRR